MNVTSQSFAALDNISGLQVIDDYAAEMVSGGFLLEVENSSGTVINQGGGDDSVGLTTGSRPSVLAFSSFLDGDSFRVTVNAVGGGQTADFNFTPDDNNGGVVALPGTVAGPSVIQATLRPRSPRSVMQAAAGNRSRGDEFDRNGNGRCDPGDTAILRGGQGGVPVEIRCSIFRGPSDRRLKTEIEVVGFSEELGIKLYSWKYRHGDSTRYVGVMAQDLLARPDLAHAVVVMESGEFAGYYAVNYQALDLIMTTESEWQANGFRAIRQPVAA